MSATISVEEAQAHLKELIGKLAPGEELVITDNQRPVARLVAEHAPERKPRVPGRCKGMITLLVEDEEHLKDFEGYMP
jgi:antitoxin (DNA-binding transcriptional repressor) of toxin-antitoxin stability system